MKAREVSQHRTAQSYTNVQEDEIAFFFFTILKKAGQAAIYILIKHT